MQQTAITAGRQQMEVFAKNQTRRRRSSPSFKVSATGSLERLGGGGGGDDDDFGDRSASRGPGGSRGGGSGDRPGNGQRTGQSSDLAPRDELLSRSVRPTLSGPDGFGNGLGEGAASRGDAPGSVFAQRGGGRNEPFGTQFTPSGPPGSPLGSSNQVGLNPPSVGTTNGSEQKDRVSGDGRAARSDFGNVGSQLNRARGADGSSGARGGNRSQQGGGSSVASGTQAGSSSRHGAAQGPGASGSPQTTSGGSPGMAFGSTDASSSPDGGEEGGSANFSMDVPVAPLSRKQGTNWALPSKPGRGASPLRRDVHIMVDEGAITVFVDPRTAQTLKIIRLGPDPDITAGELKDAVWTIMKDWGNAPAGFYWRPVLRTQITPRGVARFAQLDTLLQDSGFEMAAAR
jgi:hypothetical protein